jgi:predicted nucleic acid-binding protein
MLQVILDTNVLVAAARSSHGASSRLLELLAAGKYQIHLSVALALEYEYGLRREIKPGGLNDRDVSDIIDYLCRMAVRHEISYLWRPTLRDSDDEFILELAVVAGVEFIVTHNIRDFAGTEQFGIRAITPGKFLKQMEEQP